MGARLAVCAALLVGASSAVAGSGLAPDATGSAGGEARYTLTISFTGDWRVSSGGAAARKTTTYVVRSVKPFAIKRDGRSFTFDTMMKGSLGHTGTAVTAGYKDCVVTYTDRSVVERVEGLVTLKGRSPAPAVVNLWWVTKGSEPPIIQTREDTGDCPKFSIDPVQKISSLVWRYPSKLATKPIDWAAKFGKPFTIEMRENLDGTDPGNHLCEGAGTKACSVRYSWTLSFVPVGPVETARWRVAVSGTDSWSWGRTATLGAGVWVDWTLLTELDVEDGEVANATSKVTVDRVTPFSDPDGVFQVSHRAKTYSPYTPKKAVLRGKTLEIFLWDDPGSMYRVDFAVKLSGPQALQRMRDAGVPNPETTYEGLAKRGAIPSTAIPFVPFSNRLVQKLADGQWYPRETEGYNQQLPCKKGLAAKECFLRRGGERVTVQRIR